MHESYPFEGFIDLGELCPDNSDFIFGRIFIILADNEDSNKILDVLDFGANRTVHMIVTCLVVSHRHVMGKTLSGIYLFLIESSSNVQITRSGITSRTSVSLVQFHLLA